MGIWLWVLPDTEVCEGRWENGTVPGVMESSLNNLNVVSEDEVKTVCRKIYTNKNRKV